MNARHACQTSIAIVLVTLLSVGNRSHAIDDGAVTNAVDCLKSMQYASLKCRIESAEVGPGERLVMRVSFTNDGASGPLVLDACSLNLSLGDAIQLWPLGKPYCLILQRGGGCYGEGKKITLAKDKSTVCEYRYEVTPSGNQDTGGYLGYAKWPPRDAPFPSTMAGFKGFITVTPTVIATMVDCYGIRLLHVHSENGVWVGIK